MGGRFERPGKIRRPGSQQDTPNTDLAGDGAEPDNRPMLHCLVRLNEQLDFFWLFASLLDGLDNLGAQSLGRG